MTKFLGVTMVLLLLFSCQEEEAVQYEVEIENSSLPMEVSEIKHSEVEDKSSSSKLEILSGVKSYDIGLGKRPGIKKYHKDLGISCDEWINSNSNLKGPNDTYVRTSTSKSNIPGQCLYVNVDATECLELERNTKNEFLRPVASCGGYEMKIEGSNSPIESYAESMWMTINSLTKRQVYGNKNETCNEFFRKNDWAIAITAIRFAARGDDIGGNVKKIASNGIYAYQINYPNKCLYNVYNKSNQKIACEVGSREELPKNSLTDGRYVRPVTSCWGAPYAANSAKDDSGLVVNSHGKEHLMDVAVWKTAESDIPQTQYFSVPKSLQSGRAGETCNQFLVRNNIHYNLGTSKFLTKVYDKSKKIIVGDGKCPYVAGSRCIIGNNSVSPGAQYSPVSSCNGMGNDIELQLNTTLISSVPVKVFFDTAKNTVPEVNKGATCEALFNGDLGLSFLAKVYLNGVQHNGSCLYKKVDQVGNISCFSGQWAKNTSREAFPVTHCQDNQGSRYDMHLHIPYTSRTVNVKTNAARIGYARGVDLFDLENIATSRKGIYDSLGNRISVASLKHFINVKTVSYGGSMNSLTEVANKAYHICIDKYANESSAVFLEGKISHMVRYINSCGTRAMNELRRRHSRLYDKISPRVASQSVYEEHKQEIFDTLKSIVDRIVEVSPSSMIAFENQLSRVKSQLQTELGLGGVLSDEQLEGLKAVYSSSFAFFGNSTSLLKTYVKLSLLQNKNENVRKGNFYLNDLDNLIAYLNRMQSFSTNNRGSFTNSFAKDLFTRTVLNRNGISVENLIGHIRQNPIDLENGFEFTPFVYRKFSSELENYGQSDFYDLFQKHENLCRIRTYYFKNNVTNPAEKVTQANFVSHVEYNVLSRDECHSKADLLRKTIHQKREFAMAVLSVEWRFGVKKSISYLDRKGYALLKMNGTSDNQNPPNTALYPIVGDLQGDWLQRGREANIGPHINYSDIRYEIEI